MAFKFSKKIKLQRPNGIKIQPDIYDVNALYPAPERAGFTACLIREVKIRRYKDPRQPKMAISAVS